MVEIPITIVAELTPIFLIVTTLGSSLVSKVEK